MRSNRRLIWMASLALVLAASAGAWAQEARPKPADPFEEPLGISLGIGYSLWIADLGFETESTDMSVKYDLPAENGLEVFGQMEVADEWSLRLGGEFLFAVDTQTQLCTLGAVYSPRGLRWDGTDLHFRASILFGSHDMKDVVGHFDTSVGVEAGAGVTFWLDEYVEGLGFQIEALARYLKFSYDPDETVIASDDSVGGYGARFFAGLVYRF